MSRRQKILVAGILAFAAVGSTATIVRVPSIKGLGQTEDFLWTTTNIAIWSTVEPGIGISAGCMATLRPLMHTKLFKSCFGYVSTLRSNSHPSYPMKNQKRSTTPLSQQDVNRSATRLRSDLEQVGNTTTITSGEEQSKPNNTWRELGYSPGIYKDVMWTCTEADADQIEEPVPQASSSASTASSMPLHRYKGSHPDSHFA